MSIAIRGDVATEEELEFLLAAIRVNNGGRIFTFPHSDDANFQKLHAACLVLASRGLIYQVPDDNGRTLWLLGPKPEEAKASGLSRYDFNQYLDGSDIEEKQDGEWVKYDDVAEMLADAARFRWLLDGHGLWMEEYCHCCYPPVSADEQDKVRREIDAQVAKEKECHNAN